MACSSDQEYDNVEFLMFEHSKHVASLCDIDLTCYETFYDTSPAKDENGSVKDVKDLCFKGDLNCIKEFERHENSIAYFSRVPDIDYMLPNIDGGVHDVLNLYNIVRGELFSDFAPEDITMCLSHGIPTSMAFQQVPTSVADSIAISSRVDSVLPCPSPSTPEKARSTAEQTDKKSVIISPSPANSVESDSQETDARVPSSCRSDFLPSGWYYIEE